MLLVWRVPTVARQDTTSRLPECGTRARYKRGCRCDDCRTANNAYAKELRDRGPEKYRARNLAYCEQNREKESARAKRWYAQNQDRAKTRIKEWQKANPDKVRAAKRTGIAKKRLIEGAEFESGIDYESLWTGCCGICGEPMDRTLERGFRESPTIDHIMPLSKGGSHIVDNLQWAHWSCNSGKGAKHG